MPGEVGRFRTEGGAVITLPLPLTPVFAGQLRRHELVELEVNDETGEAASAVLQPAKSDTKGRWEEYAVSRGATVADAKSASKADLIELYGD